MVDPDSGLGTPAIDVGGNGGALGSRPDTPIRQAGPCGDGVCSVGESWCKPDCGNAEDKFLGSIKAIDVTPTSLKITWKTEKLSTGEVRYGLTENYELGKVASTVPSKEHATQIAGLSPGKDYIVGLNVTEDDGTKREALQLVFETPPVAR